MHLLADVGFGELHAHQLALLDADAMARCWGILVGLVTILLPFAL